jgi:hypothetical protein
MDLRQIINTEAGGSSAPKQQTPVTPVQTAPPQQSFKDYNQPHASPGKAPSQDYGPPPHASYASPTTYQTGYPGRPNAPPLQPVSQNDLRSPASSHYSAQSPYRNTPSSSVSGGQYPFPQNPAPQSPAQQPQYPPNFSQRDSYPSGGNPVPHLQHQNSYGQSAPVPQTPPIGTSGSSHSYVQHRRSQSGQSISTPTSTQSQLQQPPSHPHDSPASVHSYPTSQLHNSHPSQPGTPLGPPIAIPRQHSGGFAQPASPYQQRAAPAVPAPSYQQHYPPTQASPVQSQPASVSRQPSTASSYDTHRRSQSERERSLSVSPKTRLPSQTRSIDIAMGSIPDIENGSATPAKRRFSEVSDRATMQNYPGSNGGQTARIPSPQQPMKKRIRYTEPPIWARSFTGRPKTAVAKRPAAQHSNGAHTAQSGPVQAPAPKAQANGHPPTPAAAPARAVAQVDHGFGQGPLGAWEPSIIGTPPYEELSRKVADWIFLNVVNRQDSGELASRGVEVEIEAKLGQLVDNTSKTRYYLPITSECVLREDRQRSFESSMTEVRLSSSYRARFF